ncbi:MAG: DUF4235 domain-containing protein [Solirubrobacterales bacterium]
MVKVMFIPVSVAGGLLAGLLAKKAFEASWSVVDDEEPPEPEHREVPLAKLVAALALEGAIFRAARGLSDHLARGAFERATGVWPGEERPEPKTA